MSAIAYADYAPTVIVANGLDTLAKVDAWVSNDADGSAAALARYVDSAQTDPDAFVVAGTVDGEPRIHELEADAIASAATLGLVSGESGRLEIRPTLEFVRMSGGVLTVLAPALVRDLSSGRRVAVADGTREVIATVLSVDEGAGTVELDRALFADQVYIQALFVEDPERVSNAYKFSRWLTSQDLPAQPVLQGFNSELYRLLYTPSDADLADMTYGELVDDYVSHADRIGNVLDLERAIRNQALSHVDIETGIGMGPGAGIVFTGGDMLSGLFTAAQVHGTPSRSEGSDSLAVTPAALASIVAREKAILLQHVQAQKVSVSDGGLLVTGDTVLEGSLAAHAVDALGDVDAFSDLRVRGDLSADSRLMVSGVATFSGAVSARDGASVIGGLALDTLRVAEGSDLRGHTDAETVEVSGHLGAAAATVTYMDATSARVGDLYGTTAHLTGGVTADTLEANCLVAQTGELNMLVVESALQAGRLLARSAEVERAEIEALVAHGADVTGLLVAETVRATLCTADAIEAGDVDTETLTSARVVAGDVDATNIDTLALVAGEADISVLSAASARVRGTLTTDHTDAQSAYVGDLTADSATVAALEVDRASAASVIVSGAVRACTVAADEVTAASVSSDAVRAGAVHATFVAVETLDATSARVHDVTGSRGTFATVTADTVEGSQADLGRVHAGRVAAESLDVTGDVSAGTLFARQVAADAGEVGDLRVTGEARFARLQACGVTADLLDATNVEARRATVEEADVAELRVRGADVQDLSARSACLGDASADSLTARRIEALALEADLVVGKEVQADRVAGREAVFDRVDARALDVGGIVEAGDVTVRGRLETSGATVHGSARVADLEAVSLSATTAEIIAASVADLTAQEARVRGRLAVGEVLAEAVSAGTLRVRILCAVAAELDALEASEITLNGGTLDTSRGDVIMGSARATAIYSDALRALRVTTDSLTAGDVETERLAVSGDAALGSLDVAGDVRALGVSARQAGVEDLTVTGSSVFSGDVRFATGRLNLPPQVDCAGTVNVATSLTAPDAFLQRAFVTRINIGR